MISISRSFIILFLVGPALAPAAPPPPPDYGPTHVIPSLLADVSRIRAGRAFSIGIALQLEPGWHIYWTNPGDSGVPTTATFKAPEGFVVVPDPFPIPRKIKQGAKEFVYGYETPVLFSARVTPPTNLRIGDQFTFEASANWLICKEACLPGKTTQSLTMKVADHMGPTNVDPFQRWGTSVYPTVNRSPDVAGVQSTFDAQSHTATLTIHWRTLGTGVQVFPGNDDAVKITNITVKKTEDDLTPITFKIELSPDKKPASNRLAVLISYRDSTGHMRGMQSGVALK